MNLQRSRTAAAAALLLSSCSAQPSFNCDPCINRADHTVKAVLQGTKSDPFWRQVEAAMRQSERDTRVNLDLELYDSLDEERMAADIRQAIKAKDRPEALIVTIPSDTVKDAVADAVGSGVPVFGLYSGYEHFSELDMAGFVAMDQKEAGIAAGKKFLDLKGAKNGTSVSAVYVTPLITNEDFDEKRLEGLRSVLGDVKVVEESSLVTELAGCPHDAMLLASADLLEYALRAYKDNECNLDTQPLATFDGDKETHGALSSGQIKFTVSQEQYLQGAFSVVAAALAATNGKALAPSAESPFGMQRVGPVITSSDAPGSNSAQACRDEAFPVCSNDATVGGTDESACECTDRSKIKIAGVLHAVTTDAFWDVVYEAAENATNDFGVDLELDRMDPDVDSDVLHEKMAGRIESLCKRGVDGIFVTIPSEIVLEEIELCQKLNVPVISINAGPDYSREKKLYHHIGMVEKNAGIQAGKRMASQSGMKKALCLMHAPGVNVLEERCAGFEEGIKSNPDIEYWGAIDVPEDNDAKYKQIVEAYIKDKTADEGDWEGIGILLAGQPQIEPGLLLKKSHPKVLLGAFDTDEMLFDALENNEILFGIDQGPYLQGYLPVALLAQYATTGQQLANHLVESGPAFVTTAPSAEETACQASHFPVCARPVPSAAAEAPKAAASQAGIGQGGVIAISVVVVALSLSVAFLAYRIHKLNKYVRRVKDAGEEVPKLGPGSYASSMYKSPEGIVNSVRGTAA